MALGYRSYLGSAVPTGLYFFLTLYPAIKSLTPQQAKSGLAGDPVAGLRSNGHPGLLRIDSTASEEHAKMLKSLLSDKKQKAPSYREALVT